MWMNAKPFQGSVKEEIALTPLDHLSASALPDTGLMKFHRNVKVRPCLNVKWKMAPCTEKKMIAVPSKIVLNLFIQL